MRRSYGSEAIRSGFDHRLKVVPAVGLLLLQVGEARASVPAKGAGVSAIFRFALRMLRASAQRRRMVRDVFADEARDEVIAVVVAGLDA